MAEQRDEKDFTSQSGTPQTTSQQQQRQPTDQQQDKTDQQDTTGQQGTAGQQSTTGGSGISGSEGLAGETQANSDTLTSDREASGGSSESQQPKTGDSGFIGSKAEQPTGEQQNFAEKGQGATKSEDDSETPAGK